MAAVALLTALVGYGLYGFVALSRLGAFDTWVSMIMGTFGLAAVWLIAQKWPMAMTMSLVAVLPLFGNHPGGRYMELLNVPLAASAAGLLVAARRTQRPAPTGSIWRAALVLLLTAFIAMIPTLPALAVRAAQVNDARLLAVTALTAAEDDPLYSVSSISELTLAILWAYALVWSGAAADQARRLQWTLTAIFAGVIAIGIVDYSGTTHIGQAYLAAADSRAVHVVGLQSIFWHPAWFAWYFVIVFGIVIGLWRSGRAPMCWLLGALLAISYIAFFLNPQRAGLIIVHVLLFVSACDWAARSARPRRAWRVIRIAVLLVAVAAGGLWSVAAGREKLQEWNLLSLDRTFGTIGIAAGRCDDPATPSERNRLWKTALLMWGDAPMLGIGEGAFAWRYRDFVEVASSLDTPSRGDAHNTWLQVLATRGFIGLAALIWLTLALARRLWQRWQRPIDGDRTHGLVLSGLAFLIYSTVNDLFYLQAIQILFWMVVAMSADDRKAVLGGPVRLVNATLAIAALVALVGQLWQIQPSWREASRTIARQPRGFYPAERAATGAPMRWSSRSGVLCVNPAARRLLIRFAAVDPRVSTQPRILTISADGHVIDQFELNTVDLVTRLLILPSPVSEHASLADTESFGECTAESRRLGIAVNRTWSPADLGFGTDPRHLGVLVFEPHVLR